MDVKCALCDLDIFLRCMVGMGIMGKGQKEMKIGYKFITEKFWSNCLVEAIKARLRDKDVRIYFCKPQFTKNRKFQMAHFMWTDGKADYDFSDDDRDRLPWYKSFWFDGAIRQFDYGFAKRYSEYRNRNGEGDNELD